MKIKKFARLFLLPVLLCSSCNEHILGSFFKPNYLKDKNCQNLPVAPGELMLYKNIFGHEVFSKGTEEEYNTYVNSVFNYLKEQNFTYFGSVSKITNITKYHYKEATNLEDFKRNEQYYFVYSATDKIETNDNNDNILKDYRCITLQYSPSTHTYTEKDEEKSFEYNFVIRFHTSIYVVMGQKTEE